MNLQEVLDANELNRNSYNTLDRRTGLPFMKRKLDAGRGRDKYFPAHAAALGCMLDLQVRGIPAGKAASAIDSVFDRIWRSVGMIGEGHAPGASYINVIDFEDGTWGFSFGEADTPSLRLEGSGEFRSRVTVNVITVLKRLHARVNAPAEAVA